MDGSFQVLQPWYLIFEKFQCFDFTNHIFPFLCLYFLNDIKNLPKTFVGI